MKPERTVKKITQGLQEADITEPLKMVARDVAFELVHRDQDKLADFRVRTAHALHVASVNSLPAAYVRGILDVVGAYQSALEPILEKEHLFTTIWQASWRAQFLSYMESYSDQWDTIDPKLNILWVNLYLVETIGHNGHTMPTLLGQALADKVKDLLKYT